MVRRAFLALIFLCGASAADDRSRVLDILAPLARALSEGNAAGFLEPVSNKMPGYSQLVANVNALLDEADVTSSIDFSTLNGDTAEVEWSMRISGKSDAGVTEQRSQIIKVRLQKDRIIEIGPVDFWRPLSASSLR